MDHPHSDDLDAHAERSARVMAHLDGALGAPMLEAMSHVWTTLEHAAADGPAHARAVRARLFWESLRPGGAALAPSAVVHDLQAQWEDELGAAPDPVVDDLLDAEAA